MFDAGVPQNWGEGFDTDISISLISQTPEVLTDSHPVVACIGQGLLHCTEESC